MAIDFLEACGHLFVLLILLFATVQTKSSINLRALSLGLNLKVPTMGYKVRM